MSNKFKEEAWLLKSVFDQMVTEANIRKPFETGGRVFGYQLPVINICQYVGPGANAEHKLKGFFLDSSYHKEQFERIYKETEFSYLGDWHTHPEGTHHLSSIDMESAEAYFSEMEPKQPFQLSVILNGGRNGLWQPNVWIYDGSSHWQPKLVKIYTKEKGRVQSFRSSTLLTGYAINLDMHEKTL